MAAEPRNDTGDMSRLIWDNSTELLKQRNVTSLNTTDITDTSRDSENFRFTVILSVTVPVCLCGMVGNGTVIWLLGFRMKRNPNSVYILNLAIADFLYLLGNFLYVIHRLHGNIFYFCWLSYRLEMFSYPVGLSLLITISAERCVSVLWPLWYKYHRPAHLSTILCVLIWGLSFICLLLTIVIIRLEELDYYILYLYNMASFLTPSMLLVSSLILVIWGQCCSQRRQPSKLYWTILLNVLAMPLLTVPRGVYVLCCWHDSYQLDIWSLMHLLSTVNSAVNPVIYFFVGRHGIQRGRKRFREVLQSALTDEEGGTEQRRGITDLRQNVTTPEHQGGGAPPSPQV